MKNKLGSFVVADPSKCTGCRACEVACFTSHNANNNVGCTVGTINSGEYTKAIQRKAPKTEVFGLACPKFVPIVESKQYESAIAKKVVDETLEAFNDKNVDTLVMGCTHYPLLKPLIIEKMGPTVKLIDSGAETVTEVSMLLDYYDISADASNKNEEHQFFMTGSKKLFEDITHDWLNLDKISVNRITLP